MQFKMALNNKEQQVELALQFLYYLLASMGGIALGFILGVVIGI